MTVFLVHAKSVRVEQGIAAVEVNRLFVVSSDRDMYDSTASVTNGHVLKCGKGHVDFL